MTKILVFGSNGMLGKYIKTYMVDYYNVVPFSRKDYDVIKDGVTDLEKLLTDNLIDKDTVVINCIGMIPQAIKEPGLDKQGFDDTHYIKINSEFPHTLSQICNKYGAKMIHLTTDCVYDGLDGNYNEDSEHTAKHMYGISKSLGEPSVCTVIRTSIIGEELVNKQSLLEWVVSQKGMVINGYMNHYWNGITCLQCAKIIHSVIDNNMFWKGTRHIHSPDIVSKYELVQMINKHYDLKIHVNKYTTDTKCDRSLGTKYDLDIFCIKDIEEQIIEQKLFNF